MTVFEGYSGNGFAQLKCYDENCRGLTFGMRHLCPEDMSVFSYVCPSKYDYVALFKDCIDDIWKEENS